MGVLAICNVKDFVGLKDGIFGAIMIDGGVCRGFGAAAG